MSQRHKKKSYHRELSKSRQWILSHSKDLPPKSTEHILKIVLKCDSTGTLEAVTSSIIKNIYNDTYVDLIHSGVGDINMSDIVMAETGSRLIIGYQVNVLSGLVNILRERGIEIRLFNIIYSLTEDVRNIAESLNPQLSEEQVIGSARVIALFKSSRKGIIIGSEVLDGHFAPGQNFRIISAMGPVYSSKIESIHIENKAITRATRGQQIGIKIKDSNIVKIGDLVESYQPLQLAKYHGWQPIGEIVRK